MFIVYIKCSLLNSLSTSDYIRKRTRRRQCSSVGLASLRASGTTPEPNVNMLRNNTSAPKHTHYNNTRADTLVY